MPRGCFRAWALLALLLTSCGQEELTQLMVVVDTDFEVPEGLDEIAITVDAPDGQRAASEGVIEEDRLPLRLAVVHRSGPLGPLRVKVEGLLRGATVIQRRAEVWFVAGEVRELRMDLLASCRGVPCEPDQTCAAGGCRPRLVEESELPVYEGPTRLDAAPPDMGPVDMAVDACVPAEELCNGADEDCDGAIDELFDLQKDMRNCGSCGNECDPDPAQGSTGCVEGVCQLVCDPDFADCNGDPSDGCEADLSSASSCGSCGLQCTGSTPLCDVDECAADCPTGTALCGGDTCADLSTSTAHCGSCGNACGGATNASPSCADGSCALRCDMGFSNCDGVAANGCESRLQELDNCGACGASCTGSAAITSCATGDCELIGCDPGYGDCDSDVMNGCEIALSGDLANCGSCGNACPVDPANGTPQCVMGACEVACDAGYDDCDGDPSNGCEVFLGDVTSCGACGILCDGATPVCGGSPSTGFACTADCGAGQTACGMTSCVDPATDVRNCGGCGNVCPDPMRASPTCTDGGCGFTCDADFADCDGDPSNGCETDIASVGSCGSCGNVCDPVSGANIACKLGSCAIDGCLGSYRDCDGAYATGCEVDVATDPANCGACDRACTPGAHVTATACVDRGCIIETCEAGWADCDGDFTNGCEASLASRRTCGTCDNDCGGGAGGRCCDGVCGC